MSEKDLLQRTFDVMDICEQLRALERKHNGRRAVCLDGPGGSQVEKLAIEAVSGYMSRSGANPHGAFPTTVETEEILRDACQAAATSLEPNQARSPSPPTGPHSPSPSSACSRAHGTKIPRSW